MPCHGKVPGSIPGGTAKIKGLLAQLARAPALHAGGREFESLTVHKKNSVVEESGLSHLLWEQRHAGSNPVYATTIFYYQRVFIGMVLLEGRKEDLYNKYKGQIESERKLNSLFQPLSIYDMLIDEPFIQQTNYKYLEPLIQQYYFYNDIYPRQGKELEELEPNQVNTSIRAVSDMRQFVAEIVPKVQFFDTNKDKYPKKDLREYVGDWFERDFLNFTNELIKQTSEKQEEKKARKEVDKVYDSDTILIVKPKTHTASCYYGAGTKWCTASSADNTHFNNYMKDGKLFYILDKTKATSDRFYKVALLKKFEGDESYFDAPDNKFTNGWIMGTNELARIKQYIDLYIRERYAKELEIWGDKEKAAIERKRLERVEQQRIENGLIESANQRREDDVWSLDNLSRFLL